MQQIQVKLSKERETKGTVLYTAKDGITSIRNLYVEKATLKTVFGDQFPQAIAVTVTVANHGG